MGEREILSSERSDLGNTISKRELEKDYTTTFSFFSLQPHLQIFSSGK
jgi:hypothetical protein